MENKQSVSWSVVEKLMQIFQGNTACTKFRNSYNNSLKTKDTAATIIQI